jgi:FOG: WD40-like repeat
MIGHDATNSRSQPFEHRLRPANVHRLATKWVAAMAGDVSATPAVVDGAVYVGDFGGMLWKLDAETGSVIWSRMVADYTGIAGDIVRTSPSLARDTLVVGDLKAPNMLGIDARTGNLRWITQVHPDPKGIMTGSPVLAGDTIYTGVSASGASGPGATFRGAIVALDAQTGSIRWRTYSLPDNGGVAGGYAGATMFAPPAVDLSAGLVYGTFGQPYRTRVRHRVPRRQRRIYRIVRTAGGVPEICRRIRPEDRRAAMVVSHAGPRTLVAGVRQPAGRGDVVPSRVRRRESGISAARA